MVILPEWARLCVVHGLQPPLEGVAALVRPGVVVVEKQTGRNGPDNMMRFFGRRWRALSLRLSLSDGCTLSQTKQQVADCKLSMQTTRA
jgi:hypothetical protein